MTRARRLATIVVADVAAYSRLRWFRSVTRPATSALAQPVRVAVTLGDRRWRELLDAHGAAVRREISRGRGREIKATGDGFLVEFAAALHRPLQRASC